VLGLARGDLHDEHSQVGIGEAREGGDISEHSLLLARQRGRQIRRGARARGDRPGAGQLGQALGVQAVLMGDQRGARDPGHGRATLELAPQQPAEHLGVRRLLLARGVAAAAGQQHARQRPGRAEEPAATEPHHQTVESRFSISSTGRV
jgi:hypothetical protein